ncbi:hypothetical protein FACS1894187_09350 [Synergistales bacterium]|nr:hypothetical protein FACS1894187_09350 [Synergistales bacterium]
MNDNIDNIEIFAKDDVKFNLLSALLDGRAEMRLFLESDGQDKPYSAMRDGQRAENFRIGSFAVKENQSDDSVTFRPVVIGCPVVFTVVIIPASDAGGFSLEVMRPPYETALCRFELFPGKNSLSLTPLDFKKYSFSFSGAKPPARPMLSQGDDTVVTVADVTIMAQELEELESVFGVDRDILSRYLRSGEDGESARRLMSEVSEAISRAQSGVSRLEEQIRLFVQKKQQKILDIENSLRNSGRAI